MPIGLHNRHTTQRLHQLLARTSSSSPCPSPPVLFARTIPAPPPNAPKYTLHYTPSQLPPPVLTPQSPGQLVSSLVTRQLTLEERDALLVDPSAWQPVSVEEQQLVAVPDIVAVG